jgi:hypothetical protein
MIDVIGSDGDIWYRIDAPILGTIRDCHQTKLGWRGIMPDGRVTEFRSDYPGVRAKIPDGGAWGRAPDGRLLPCIKSVPAMVSLSALT